ncbi:MAG: ATP-dependent DNA helicase RecG, partial [Candidatus Omnitrophota bacterium]
VTDSKTSKFIKGFGFDLTNAQKKVIREVRDDMAKPSPMLRLLQGDVGSGKTVAALFGCYNAYLNKKQSAIMAPTEILARQHFESIKKAIVDGPIKDAQVALLVGSMKKKEKNTVLGAIERGDVDIVIGTHSLISEQTQFKDLTYVVVDEQHKFGVRQRAILSEKGNNPDVLIMTATPIPRTLCITLYGDLDLSIIDEMPKGRGKVHTKKFGHGGVETVYGFVRSKVKEGRQVFFVYPIIEESEILDLKAAEDMYAQFKTETFKDLKIGIVHGKLKRDETDVIMGRFRAGEIDILIATTVVEVGVDVANATVMVIENAERFGLSQLHQLRGRIGRGEHEGYCCLVSDPTTEEGIKRLKALVSTTDGFKIAQNDLEIRGPGRYFGRHQHGLNELRVANPITQLDILKLAREEALLVTKKDPYLEHAGNRNIKRVIFRRYPTFLTDVEAG